MLLHNLQTDLNYRDTHDTVHKFNVENDSMESSHMKGRGVGGVMCALMESSPEAV